MKETKQSNETPMRPHEADGIAECDNPLPQWWVGLFIGCIVYAVVYLFYYHGLGKPDHLEDYHAAVAQRSEKLAAGQQLANNGGDLSSRITQPDFIEAGIPHYTATCTPCHGAKGEGGIGPNLTDKFWIHGGSPEDIVKVLEQGVLTKGMPAWKDILGRKKIEQITALLVSWRGLDIPGKAAQGEPYND